MELEKEIEALILESREIKFIDNKQSTSIGTFGRVSPRLLQWYKNFEKIIYNNAGVFSKAWKDFENFDVDKVNGNHAGEFNKIKTGIIDILRTLVIKSDPLINSEDINKSLNNEIFIVHGHNESVKQTTARTLSKLGLEPIILHERPDGGKTIIEKFEKNISNIGFALILLTNDDEGKARTETDLKARARQNVIPFNLLIYSIIINLPSWQKQSISPSKRARNIFNTCSENRTSCSSKAG